MKLKIFIFALFLWFFWIILTSSLSFSSLLTGLVCTFLTVAICWPFLSEHTERFKVSHWTIFRHFPYVLILLKEVIMANLDVAERVLDPQLPIEPAVVRLKSPVKGELAQTALANSITLTPGTLTIDIKGDEFYIHCLAEEYVEGIFEGPLQKWVMWLYREEIV
ncbi:MAG: Na+/H+ antiporter subunit E [Actinobacteria bacterium]|nr:Na+/H+ antiporter subunit E [Actinomycetota bacterium]